jgi:hypothetical protein
MRRASTSTWAAWVLRQNMAHSTPARVEGGHLEILSVCSQDLELAGLECLANLVQSIYPFGGFNQLRILERSFG